MSTPIDSAQINKLISENHYDEAKAILRESNDPAAQAWLARLDQSYPTPKPASTATDAATNLTAWRRQRERGLLLTIFLVGALIANPLQAFINLVNIDLISGGQSVNMLPAPSWVVLAVILLPLIATIFLIGIWKWQKWAVIAYLILDVVIIILNLLAFGAPTAGANGLKDLILVFVVVTGKWEQFE